MFEASSVSCNAILEATCQYPLGPNLFMYAMSWGLYATLVDNDRRELLTLDVGSLALFG
eukprot:CAMPEP_0117524914 /NCGR_PEP_ID=MMETSP0784-20121206/35496_1 /TAXON_ID=39447 /ORGANISM="" /LENGTH=58 /DNA_ID=CAMNT_0005321087 /DNA_START=95 /DNA_END=267 /DNA_ORIENTATION=+